MAYRFPLAAVLRVRELAAEREELALARLHADIAATRRGIERLESEIVRTAQVRQQVMASGNSMRAAHLQASYAGVRELRATHEQLQEQLRRQEQARDAQIRVWEAAYQKREVLTGLRDSGRSAWTEAQRKLEQKQAEEGFLARFGRDGE